MTKISIIGSGVVGTIIGRGFKSLGNELIFYDVSENRVEELRGLGLDATSNMTQAVKRSDISFICVPTPTVRGKIDLSQVWSAARELGKGLRDKRGYHLVVVKSTVVPTTTERVVIPILEGSSGKRAGRDIGVCVNPEFLTEIQKSWTEEKEFKKDFFSEDRIVIGEFDKRSGGHLQRLYRPLKIPIFRTDLKTAEMIKYAANCCLLSRISYWNEIFLICNKMGIDAQRVAEIVAMDKRIGRYGSVLGKAAGGKCLEKDTAAFISSIRGIHKPRLLQAVLDINLYMAKKYGRRE